MLANEATTSMDEAKSLAAISVVKVSEMAEAITSASELSRLQDSLNNDKNRAKVVKNMLDDKEPHEVRKELVTDVDKELESIGVSIKEDTDENDHLRVLGAEDLGRTLMPSEFLISRIAGCEDFISNAYKALKASTDRIGSYFKDAYILATESQNSMEQSLRETMSRLSDIKKLEQKDTIYLGSRMFNLFKVNGEFPKDVLSEFIRLDKTIGALTKGFYLNNKTNLNNLFAFFGGFADINEDQALERLLLLPTSSKSERFKECNYRVKHMPFKELRHVDYKQSVELMGGGYFLDARITGYDAILRDEDELSNYLELRMDADKVFFISDSPTIFPKANNVVQCLTLQQMTNITKLMLNIIAEWRKVFDNNTFAINDSTEFKEISKSFIANTALTDVTKVKIFDAFSRVIGENQKELINLRSKVNQYLILLMHGMIGYIDDSLENSEEV